MIKIIMIREITKIDIDPIAEIEGQHIEEEVSIDKIIEENHVMLIIIEMTLEETILEKCENKEITILEVDTE